MVERSQTAGWLPSLYEPIKKAGQKIANWFAQGRTPRLRRRPTRLRWNFRA
jgi:hypothetical protein